MTKTVIDFIYFGHKLIIFNFQRWGSCIEHYYFRRMRPGSRRELIRSAHWLSGPWLGSHGPPFNLGLHATSLKKQSMLSDGLPVLILNAFGGYTTGRGDLLNPVRDRPFAIINSSFALLAGYGLERSFNG